MANAMVTVWCLTGLLVSTASVAQAQYGADIPREGACFYRDADHRGRSFCIQSGDEVSSLPGGFDDEVSSIRTYGRVEVLVYRDTRFRGDSRQFTSNVRDLQNEDFNDRISSVEVRRRGGWGSGAGGGSSSQNPERIIRRAYQDVLQREPDQAGMRLYRSRIIDDGWSEQQVREALRNSPEYKQLHTMTWPKAQDIVRRAYLNVLNREPDAGSRGFVERVFKDKWTQTDVERELRKSAEYRAR
jgi:hypothetical protein